MLPGAGDPELAPDSAQSLLINDSAPGLGGDKEAVPADSFKDKQASPDQTYPQIPVHLILNSSNLDISSHRTGPRKSGADGDPVGDANGLIGLE